MGYSYFYETIEDLEVSIELLQCPETCNTHFYKCDGRKHFKCSIVTMP